MEEVEIKIHAGFKDSLRDLSGQDQDKVKKLLATLYEGGFTPGMRVHQLEGDAKGFLSLSSDMDLRIIAGRKGDTYTLLHVDHHDEAYRWAERHGVLVQGNEVINLSDSDLIPDGDEDEETVPIPVRDILEIRDDDKFLSAIETLSPEWQNWLLESRTEGLENTSSPPTESSLVHVPGGQEELIRALDADLPDWRLFLHPRQKQAVNDRSSQLIAISGGPGTGKTVVLLNRLLENSPKKEKRGCGVMLTYSKGLANHLINLLRDIESRYYYVFSLDLLQQLDDPKSSVPQRGGEEVRLELNSEGLWVRHHYLKEIPVRELLVDEFQDTPKETVGRIERVLSDSDHTTVVLAKDDSQSIFRAKNETAVRRLWNKAGSHYRLNHSYRTTKQIVEKSKQWKEAHGQTPDVPKSIDLAGPDVRFVSSLDLAHQVQSCVDTIDDLRSRYSDNEIALIYCQYPNPSFSGESKEENTLKDHPQLRHFYVFASVAKGREYKAGVIFVSNSFMADSESRGEMGSQLRAIILYVSLTRFRDEITVVYPVSCPVKQEIEAMRNG
jgi:mRNA-degrading endonuclease YafQ of YafQ-DinJ toxin-antitoxin module